jgi:ATP synthase protein I
VSRATLQITRSQINRCFLVQLLTIFAATFIFFLFQGFSFAQSIFLGGFLCVLPQWLFACVWLAYYKASAAPKIMRVFYVGEVIKLLLTGVLFVLTLRYIPVNPLACLGGFMLAQLAFWMAPLVWPKKILM